MNQGLIYKKIRTIQTWRILGYVALHLIIFGHQIFYKLGLIEYGNSNAIDFVETIENGTIRFGTIFMALWFLAIPIYGRLLCGWACHMGALQDFGHFLLKKFIPFKKHLNRVNLRDSKILKFALPTIVLMTIALPPIIKNIRINAETGRSPLSLSVNLKKEVTPFEVSETEIFLSWFLVGFVFVGAFGKRPVCRYVCPFASLVLRPLQSKSLYKIRKTGDCVDCNACSEKCIIGIDVAQEIQKYGYVKSNDCVDCFSCIDHCHYDTLSFTTKTGNEDLASANAVDPYKQAKLAIWLEVAILILAVAGAIATYEDTGTIVVVIPLAMVGLMLASYLYSTIKGFLLKKGGNLEI